MPQFIMTTYGGTPPADARAGQAFMAAWSAWSEGVTFVSPPTPCGGAEVVGGGAAPLLNGWLVFEAATRDAARAIVAACPHVTELGGSVQVAEVGTHPGTA